MPQTLIASFFVTPTILETTAKQSADEYLKLSVCVAFSAIDSVFVPLEHPYWQFAIEFALPTVGKLGIMGTLDVSALTGQVIPLSESQIEQMQDRASAIVLYQRSNHLLSTQPAIAHASPFPHIDKKQAHLSASHYLQTVLPDQFHVASGTLVPSSQPVWLFDIRWQVDMSDVGVICVNAQTGNVIPLSTIEIQEILQSASYVATPYPYPTTTAV